MAAIVGLVGDADIHCGKCFAVMYGAALCAAVVAGTQADDDMDLEGNPFGVIFASDEYYVTDGTCTECGRALYPLN